MNAEKKWYHALMEDVYSGEQYILGVLAYNEDHANKMVYYEKHKKFGDEAMFHIFKDWLTDAEAEASGLDEF